MEAPERDKPILLCQKCFALIPPDAEFCAECGAPVLDDFAEGSDTAVYPELARANLFRMRGEYKQAEEICLAILRRHPNSATANTLLGDICAERGDLTQAAEWYEMALDITPDSASDRSKLEKVRNRIREHEAAQTAKTLGLPESRPKIGLWVGGAVAFVLLVAAVAFLLGERLNARKSKSSNAIVAPVSIPLDASRNSSNGGKAEEAVPSESAPSGDLATRIRAGLAAESGRVIGASRFPQSMGVLLTFVVTGTEDPRRYAADLAKNVLNQVSDAPSVTLVALRDDKVVHVGTVTRERLNQTQTEEWRTQNRDDLAAFANAVLADEWPPPASTGASEPPPADDANPPGDGNPAGG